MKLQEGNFFSHVILPTDKFPCDYYPLCPRSVPGPLVLAIHIQEPQTWACSDTFNFDLPTHRPPLPSDMFKPVHYEVCMGGKRANGIL